MGQMATQPIEEKLEGEGKKERKGEKGRRERGVR
jgi:hypothetical protein